MEKIEGVLRKRNNSISDFRKCPQLSNDNLDERQKWVEKTEAITGVQASKRRWRRGVGVRASREK